MFKKLKDKIAEEVKSSPQRIQQFAQAAQAAVTSASSSISDISNNDLFSIADDETPQNTPRHSSNMQQPVGTSGFQDVSLMGASSSTSNTPSPLKGSTGSSENNDSLSPLSNHNPAQIGNTGIYPPPPGNSSSRLRKLSNSSNASDVSFRLPSYESPGGMYHLQSDLDVSASEMEDSVSIPAQLERVSKEQLFAAYRRSNEKYNKYRGRYTDLARHYRNLERENAKARAVLVETQDKALRRISELREQCALEQSAKAHLESALRMELDERNMKIESLNTKIKLLHSFSQGTDKAPPLVAADDNKNDSVNNTNALNNGESSPNDNHQPLIDFSSSDQQDSSEKLKDHSLEDVETKHSQEIFKLNDKIQKLEQLLAKCKEAIKTQKEKNSQVTSELQIVSNQMEKKNVENAQLQGEVSKLEALTSELNESKDRIATLKSELDSFESKKAEAMSSVQNELKCALDEIVKLNKNIDVMRKREEENAISLAENKLSIHKELESKENEIKVLKDKISAANLEIKTNEATLKDLKAEIKTLEFEKCNMKEQLRDFEATKEELKSLESKLEELKNSYGELEGKCATLTENIKCKDLELKQEIDEKMAMKDRNNFLEGRNKQLNDENLKKNKQIADLEKEVTQINKESESRSDVSAKCEDLIRENDSLKADYTNMLGSKEELENELNIVNSKCREVENSLDNLTNDNGALKSQLDKLQGDFSDLQTAKADLENLVKKYESDKAVLAQQHSKTKELLELQVKELEDRLRVSSETNESQQTNVIEKIQQEMRQKMEESEGKIKKTFEDRLSQFDALTKECELLRVEIGKREKTISDLEHSMDDRNSLQNKCDELSNDKANLESKLKEMQSIIDDLNKVRSENEELVGEKQKFEEKLTELDDVIKERNQLKNIYEELLKENNVIVARIGEFDSTSKELREVKELNDEMQAEKDVLESRLDEISKERDELSKVYNQLSKEKESFERRVEGFATESNILKEECEQLRNDKKDLEDRIAALELENAENTSRRNALVQDIQQLQSEILSVHNSHSQIVSQKNSIEEKIALMEKTESMKKNEFAVENEEFKVKIQELHSDKDKMICEKAELIDKLKELEEKVNEKSKEHSENNEVWQVKLSNILDENNSLQEKCSRLKQEKDSLCEKLTHLESKVVELDSLKKKSEETKLEIEFLNMRVSQLDNDLSIVKSEKNKALLDKDSLQKELSVAVSENKNKLGKINEDLVKLNAELDKANREKTAMQSKLGEERLRNEELIVKLNSTQDRSNEMQVLSNEKSTLLEQLEELRQKYKDLENANTEEIETLQTANSDLNNKCEKLELKCKDFEELSDVHSSLKAENETMLVKMQVLEKIEAEYKNMLEEKHSLKSEVSKLTSDIEGLQTHLKKVSKDNSQLNDRIRELEANGEIMQQNIQHKLESTPGGFNAVEMQTQLNKLTEANAQLLEELNSSENLQSKILDLERQNSILIDEKLELQDQINSSMDRQHRTVNDQNSERDSELNRLQTQCKELLNSKMDMEGRLADLELISRSGDSSIRALEQKNEKLKLTNEKLERRLDEALVSLNHIRTLEENTELEYLRNILYEYLTGPSNNNMVLAKVLAAVVKFDQRQTQIVLEREKEKQGVLGQLGLL